MDILTNIIAFLIAICILILAHEFGHFCVAKLCKIKVRQFSIGFGRAIWRHKSKSGTEYVLAPFLIGGYVRLLDTREGDVAAKDQSNAFDKRPMYQRMLIVAAGPITNFFLAIIIFSLMFTLGIKTPKAIVGKVLPDSIAATAGIKANDEITAIDSNKVHDWQQAAIAIISRLGDKGHMQVQVARNNYQLALSNWRIDPLMPDPIRALGIWPYQPKVAAVIAKVFANASGANMGLKSGDKILAINGQVVTSWNELVEYLRLHPKAKVKLQVERDGKKLQLHGALGSKLTWGFRKIGYLGVTVPDVAWPDEAMYMRHYGFFGSWWPAINHAWLLTKFNFIVVGKLVTGKLSLRLLSGPLAVFQGAELAFREGVAVYLGFLAFLSIMLGIINMLPIPGLDGGILLFLLIEMLIRRPISAALQALLFRIGLIALLVLVFQATLNDLMRLFV